PFLGQQRRDVTLTFGRLINPLCFLAFANNAANAPLADGHEEFVDRGVMRQGEDIDSLDLSSIGIVELLRDLDRGNVSADCGFNVGVLEGKSDFVLLIRQLRRQGAAARSVRVALSIVAYRTGDDPEFFGGGRKRSWRRGGCLHRRLGQRWCPT